MAHWVPETIGDPYLFRLSELRGCWRWGRLLWSTEQASSFLFFWELGGHLDLWGSGEDVPCCKIARCAFLGGADFDFLVKLGSIGSDCVGPSGARSQRGAGKCILTGDGARLVALLHTTSAPQPKPLRPLDIEAAYQAFEDETLVMGIV